MVYFIVNVLYFDAELIVMGKEQELILAAKTGNVAQIDKILSQRAKKSGPLLRFVASNIFCCL